MVVRLKLIPKAAFLLLVRLSGPLYPLIMKLLKKRALKLSAVAGPVILPAREGA